MRRLMGFEAQLVWEFDVLIQFALKHVGQNGSQLLSRNVSGVFQTALLQVLLVSADEPCRIARINSVRRHVFCDDRSRPYHAAGTDNYARHYNRVNADERVIPNNYGAEFAAFEVRVLLEHPFGSVVSHKGNAVRNLAVISDRNQVRFGAQIAVVEFTVAAYTYS